MFTELMCDFTNTETETVVENPIADEFQFLINSLDPSYGDIIIYLQTQTFFPQLSSSHRQRIRYQSQQYNIVGDTLYRRGEDSIF